VRHVFVIRGQSAATVSVNSAMMIETRNADNQRPTNVKDFAVASGFTRVCSPSMERRNIACQIDEANLYSRIKPNDQSLDSAGKSFGSACQKVAPRRNNRRIPSSRKLSCSICRGKASHFHSAADRKAFVGADHRDLLVLALPSTNTPNICM